VDFSKISLINAMHQQLSYRSARQAVLAQNVANAATPGYGAQDVKPPLTSATQFSVLKPVHMAVTSEKHMQPQGMAGFSSSDMHRANTYERSPTNNNVVIEEEMMRVAENQAEYQKVLNLYRKTIGMFNIALGRGGSAA
jgi:flagellar basal-body rod protein FlgB